MHSQALDLRWIKSRGRAVDRGWLAERTLVRRDGCGHPARSPSSGADSVSEHGL